ncbi:phenoloxidase 2-like [Episyrphus balteatus]|uniref:phenoloxidase 2-like n=1 Tax=Episyrphus balteatus TaxID=286459 RepID=UPI002485DB0E|nr:phenoloxidase 2-like [Episyrphus balteatus]
MADKKNLLLLLERPQEPVFMVKGKEATVFDIPDKYFTDRYKPLGNVVTSKFGENVDRKIPVKDLPQPDLREVMALGRREPFSLFIPRHSKIASKLIDIFMQARSIDELQSRAVYARDRVNPILFNYALSVALLHRSDTKGLNLPSFVETFPDKFIDSKVISQVREEATVVKPESRRPIIVPRDYTASDLDEEHRLWYFREDMGLNLHHWHWHLIYPPEASDRAIVAKDRRGELFYYMHQQIVARYNLERFCNNMARVKRFNNLREPIAAGYFPKMDSLVASRAWPPRGPNTKISDLNRETDQIKVDIDDLERWRDRIYEAIHQGFVVNESGKRIPLDETKGIDILGDILDSSILSVNRQFYGNLHGFGHVFISFAHDPDHRHLENFSVMGDNTTTMRDPAFYNLHSFVDDIFQTHKELLPPYTLPELSYRGIIITGIQVASKGGKPNVLNTYWQQSDIDLSRGMDFVPRGNVLARFTHLQHDDFEYTINVNNDSGAQRFGTVRIFLGPKFDERGQQMLYRDQRLLMIELDKFIASLKPGANTLRRKSTDSSLTIPFERTFRNVDINRPAEGTPDELEFNFCGCGWPQHLLIPKGRPEGMQFQLFVMISDYEVDRVDQDLVGSCSDASSYCGVRDRLYPDRRSMGYPFDRLSRTGTDNLAKFLTPNMRVTDITIRHTDRTTMRQ